MKITGERDGFLTRDVVTLKIFMMRCMKMAMLNYFSEVGSKENIAKVNQELNELHAEIAKWQQKMETSEKQAKKRKI